MAQYDYIIVGGGIVGLSVAWSILEQYPHAKLAILEKELDWAQHQTGRNSGVIHSGIYYKPGSLKAALCREGNRRLQRFCLDHGIAHEVCGKLIVATEPHEIPLLENLAERASANQIAATRLDQEAVREIEPHVRCLAGLHVPSTGIISFGDVCRKLVELIRERGGDPQLGVQARQLRVFENEIVVESNVGDFHGGWLINCAGLQSDRVARLSHLRPDVQIVPFRGEYYDLKPERRSLVRNLIYPVPDPEFPFLGVHFTRMIDGAVHAGPNAVLSLKREGYHRTAFSFRDCADTLMFPGFWRLAAKHARTGWEEIRRSFSKGAFVRSLQRLIPELEARDLVAGSAGVRAQAVRRDGVLVDDFLICKSDRATHVCNAPSPAATAAFAIGRKIITEVPQMGTRIVSRPGQFGSRQHISATNP